MSSHAQNTTSPGDIQLLADLKKNRDAGASYTADTLQLMRDLHAGKSANIEDGLANFNDDFSVDYLADYMIVQKRPLTHEDLVFEKISEEDKSRNAIEYPHAGHRTHKMHLGETPLQILHEASNPFKNMYKCSSYDRGLVSAAAGLLKASVFHNSGQDNCQTTEHARTSDLVRETLECRERTGDSDFMRATGFDLAFSPAISKGLVQISRIDGRGSSTTDGFTFGFPVEMQRTHQGETTKYILGPNSWSPEVQKSHLGWLNPRDLVTEHIACDAFKYSVLGRGKRRWSLYPDEESLISASAQNSMITRFKDYCSAIPDRLWISAEDEHVGRLWADAQNEFTKLETGHEVLPNTYPRGPLMWLRPMTLRQYEDSQRLSGSGNGEEQEPQ